MPGTPRAGIIPVTPFQQNCTLIWDEATKVGAVVDPGGDLDRIQAAIAEQGVSVEKILLTTAMSTTRPVPTNCARSSACRSRARTSPTSFSSIPCR